MHQSGTTRPPDVLSRGGILMFAGGVGVLVGAFLPLITLFGNSGSTIDLISHVSDWENTWPVLIVASGIVIAVSAVFYLAGPDTSRGAIGLVVAAVIGLAVGLAMGPIRAYVETQSAVGSLGLVSTEGCFSLDLGFWPIVAGGIIAVVGAWIAFYEPVAVSQDAPVRQAAPAGSSVASPATTLAGNTASPGASMTVPSSLTGPPSAKTADGAYAQTMFLLQGETPEALVRQLVALEERESEKRGLRVVEAVWSSTSPPEISAALGSPDVRYRPKWPGRPTVRWASPSDAPTLAGDNEPVSVEEPPIAGRSTGDTTSEPTTAMPAGAVDGGLDAGAASPTEAPIAETATDDRPLKQCPDCAEMVLAAARICRYCRHEFWSDEAEQAHLVPGSEVVAAGAASSMSGGEAPSSVIPLRPARHTPPAQDQPPPRTPSPPRPPAMPGPVGIPQAPPRQWDPPPQRSTPPPPAASPPRPGPPSSHGPIGGPPGPVRPPPQGGPTRPT